jgi:hypothetical protein
LVSKAGSKYFNRPEFSVLVVVDMRMSLAAQISLADMDPSKASAKVTHMRFIQNPLKLIIFE